MRNLKKILALVLALVMTFSVMSVASASFKDFDKVTGDYAEAVEILEAINVFRGYEDGTFKPQNTITRAEVAAIIYRIDTGDVDDAQFQIYADYNRFSDVKSTDWYAGYVNYCANAEYVNGYGDGTFGPNDKVTGYQALAMILRVVGYDKNKEFTGSAWQIEVAKYANKLGITANVSANTLGVDATRELIAELLWRTVYEVPQVTYTPALGYNQHKDIVNKTDANLNNTINEDWLNVQPFDMLDDQWGRPSYGWTIYTGTRYEDILIIHAHTPDFVEYRAVTHCEVATVLGLTKNNQDVELFTNGYPYGGDYEDNDYRIYRLNNDKDNANHLIGGQGTYVAVYNFPGTADDRVILVDTYLAYISGVQKQVTDKAGHIKTPASSTVSVFGDNADGSTWNYKIDGNEFAKGTMLLASYYYYPVYKTDANGEYVLDADDNLIIDYWTSAIDYLTGDEFVLRAPIAIQGKQTRIWSNADKHTIEQVDYNDNVNFYHDEAGYDRSAAWTWYLDEHNNVIGSFEIYNAVEKQYAVVLGIQWINGVGQYGYASATLQYMDGTIVEDVAIDYVGNNETKYAGGFPGVENALSFADGWVYTTLQYNQYVQDTTEHLYEVVVDAYGYLHLVQVTDELVDVKIQKGVSKLNNLAEGVDTFADPAVYTDNETLFVYWIDANGDGWNDSLKFVKGYQNAELASEFYPAGQMYAYQVDYVFGDNDDFASIAYIYNSASVGKTDIAENYYYLTNETNWYTLKKNFVVSGAYGVDGKQADLTIKADRYGNTVFGTEQETDMFLQAMVALYKDVLIKVTTTNGYVTAIKPVFDGELTAKGLVAKLVTFGNAQNPNYIFYDRGVIKVGDLALNVNSATAIRNEEGEAITFSELAELYGANLYIVYAGTTAKAIFVTPTNVAGTAVRNYLNDLRLNDMVKSATTGLVYTLNADTQVGELTYKVGNDTFVADLEADIEDLDAITGIVNAMDLAGINADVTVVFDAVNSDEYYAAYRVTLTAGDYSRSTTLFIRKA